MHPSRFVIGPGGREAVAQRIASMAPLARIEAAQAADRIVAGEFDLLGYRALRFGGMRDSVPDWHVDPVSGRRAPTRFWTRVPYLDPAGGDHKVIWELNRHQHLLMLGRAYWLTGREAYRRTAIRHVTDWIEANPPLTGINWASMLELGFRALSWLWAVHFFAGHSRQDEEPWLVDLLVALDRQLRHIQRNLSYYFSPNTHLLGEALALYTAGRSLTCLRRSRAYATAGRAILLEQAARQVGADGGHLERSTHYHRYTLDFYVLALLVARITGDSAAVAPLEQVVARLAFAARLLADDTGRLPHIGDDDGGMLLPLCGRSPDDVRDSLAVAGALTDEATLMAGGVAEEALWLLNHPSLAQDLDRLVTAPVAPPPASAALPDMGYYVSRHDDGTHVVFDAGRHGFANGGHAHADALSLTLSVGGTPVLIDPGTAFYTIRQDERDRFRSSAYHNTLVVDGRSQSIASGPFHWASMAHGTAEAWRAHAAFDYAEGTHDGYAPVTHRRHLMVVHGDLLVVADVLTGGATHRLDAYWHLHPRWLVQRDGRQARLFTGDRHLTWACSGGTVACMAGGAPESAGWWSPRYGLVEPAPTLHVSLTGSLPLCLVSAFTLGGRNDLVGIDRIEGWIDASSDRLCWGASIRRARSTDLVGVSAPAHATPDMPAGRGPSRWKVADIETDARAFISRLRGERPYIAFVDGSYFSSSLEPAAHVRLARQVAAYFAVPAGMAHRPVRRARHADLAPR